MMHTKQKAIRVQSLKWSLLESMASNQLVLICGRMQLGGRWAIRSTAMCFSVCLVFFERTNLVLDT